MPWTLGRSAWGVKAWLRASERLPGITKPHGGTGWVRGSGGCQGRPSGICHFLGAHLATTDRISLTCTGDLRGGCPRQVGDDEAVMAGESRASTHSAPVVERGQDRPVLG